MVQAAVKAQEPKLVRTVQEDREILPVGLAELAGLEQLLVMQAAMPQLAP